MAGNPFWEPLVPFFEKVRRQHRPPFLQDPVTRPEVAIIVALWTDSSGRFI